ncbi:MAG: hypothetical protein ACI4VE_02575 [Clostridia bacterium]
MLDEETLELFKELAVLQEQKYRLAESEINYIIKKYQESYNDTWYF